MPKKTKTDSSIWDKLLGLISIPLLVFIIIIDKIKIPWTTWPIKLLGGLIFIVFFALSMSNLTRAKNGLNKESVLVGLGRGGPVIGIGPRWLLHKNKEPVSFYAAIVFLIFGSLFFMVMALLGIFMLFGITFTYALSYF